jgi:VanZ family protein
VPQGGHGGLSPINGGTLRRNHLLLALGYTLLICYATLYPFKGWTEPSRGFRGALFLAFPDHLSRSDLVVNLLAYLPLGFFWQRLRPRGRQPMTVSLQALAVGFCLSYGLEVLQAWLPARVSSLSDLIANSAGAFAGALAADRYARSSATPAWRSWRAANLLPGALSEPAWAALAFWALAQWAPFVPTVDLGELKNGIKPLWFTLIGRQAFNYGKAAQGLAGLAGLGLLALSTAKDRARRRVYLWFQTLALAALLAKPFFAGRALSLELCGALPLAALLTALLALLPRRIRAVLGVLLLVGGFAVGELTPGDTPRLQAFNWFPFRSHLTNEMAGIGSILDGLWPFLAAGCLVFSHWEPCARRVVFAGGVAVFFGVLGLEFLQLGIPGRTADVTQALIALAGWCLPLVWTGSGTRPAPTSLPGDRIS